jgi:dolichol-phosphate mannosyltransferase
LKKLVIIPTYNEKENIREITDAIFSLNKDYHILVIDDGSPDGTADIVRARQSVYPDSLFLETRKGKLGLGTAYIHGFKWALARAYDYIFEMDADFSHNPNDLERLYDAVTTQGFDVAVGSRYVKGGDTANWSWDRNVLSRGASLYTRMITWIPVKDSTAGFVCYKREVLESMDFSAIRFVGYAFQIEMKFAAWKLGYRIKEVPITFVDRKLGSSKMSKGIIKEGVLGVISIQWHSITKDYHSHVKSKNGSTT